MKYEVYAWWKNKTLTYTGKGASSRSFINRYDDRETAERKAKEMVEARGAHFAIVEVK